MSSQPSDASHPPHLWPWDPRLWRVTPTLKPKAGYNQRIRGLLCTDWTSSWLDCSNNVSNCKGSALTSIVTSSPAVHGHSCVASGTAKNGTCPIIPCSILNVFADGTPALNAAVAPLYWTSNEPDDYETETNGSIIHLLPSAGTTNPEKLRFLVKVALLHNLDRQITKICFMAAIEKQKNKQQQV